MVTTTARDSTAFLANEEEIAAFLDAAFEEGDPALIVAAICGVAKARGITDIATKAGIFSLVCTACWAKGAFPPCRACSTS